MTNEDWIDWRSNPVTKVFFASVRERQRNIEEVNILQAGANQENDCVNRGYWLALNDVLDTSYAEVDQTIEES